jgi:hypothetical protein
MLVIGDYPKQRKIRTEAYGLKAQLVPGNANCGIQRPSTINKIKKVKDQEIRRPN